MNNQAFFIADDDTIQQKTQPSHFFLKAMNFIAFVSSSWVKIKYAIDNMRWEEI